MKNRKFFVTERDAEVLLAIFKSKILTLEMIYKFFFSGSTKSNTCRRLQQLIQHGYLLPKPVCIDRRRLSAFSLTPLGVKEIDRLLDYEVTHRYYISDSVDHDLDLVEIDDVVKRFNAVQKVLSESELQSCTNYTKIRDLVPFVKLRSDRVLSVESDNGLEYVALEYERSVKSQKRNIGKLQDYYSKARIPAVFYVCKDHSVARALSKVDAEITKDRKSKVYFSTLSELQEATAKVTFQRHDGYTIDFKLNL